MKGTLSTICSLLGVSISGCGEVREAFFDPGTIIPLAGASIIYAIGVDDDISDWAREHKPIYGSRERAIEIKDSIKEALEIESYATAIVAEDRAVRLGVAIISRKATKEATSAIKDVTRRTRPNGGNDQSFPSGCTSGAFASMRISNENIDAIEWMREEDRRALKLVNLLLASGVGWSRVESGAHYPSDVLVGAALGNFVSVLVHDATFLIIPSDRGVMIGKRIEF